MAWNEAVVTNAGMNLLAASLLGGGIDITGAVGGEACVDAIAMLAQTEIAGPQHVFNIAKKEVDGHSITVNVRIQNKGVAAAYSLRQIGLLARLSGTDDNEILFAVIQDRNGEEIPTEEENPEFLVEFDFVIPVSNTENIHIETAPQTLATLMDLEEVRAEAAAAGNPEYETVSEPAELTSGESIGAAFSKISAAVKGLIAHLADKARHVTMEEKEKLSGIEEKANNYTHPNSGVTAGTYRKVTVDARGHVTAGDNATLAVVEGGTGATDAETARKNLGLGKVDNTTDAEKAVKSAESAGTCTGNAATATKWATARNINGMSVDGSANRANYGTCSTAAATAEKVVACAGFALATGAEITVKFTVTNTAANPTLNVNATGAKAVYYRGAAIGAGYLAANRTYTFRYNGTQYEFVGDIDTNTTYGAASASANGLMSTGVQTFAGAKTFNGAVKCAGASDVVTAQARNIYAGTVDMTPGTTALATGTIYVMYE